MTVWKRLFALTSTASVVAAAAVYVGGSGAAAQSASVSFTSQPTTSQLLAHYVVSPTSGPKLAASASTEESALAPKWPKGHGPASIVGNTGGVTGNNSGSSTPAMAAPGTTSSFIGQQGSATTCSYFGRGCNPPDMGLAASPQFVLQGVNTQWEVLDSKGNVQPGWPVSAQNFFGVPNATGVDGQPCDTAHQSQPFMSDPRALYDPADGRFWAAMLQVEGAQAFGVALDCPYKSVYFIAVSQTSNPSGKWNVYEFNMETDVNGQKFAADFTQIGLNSQAVYFSANNFGEQGGVFADSCSGLIVWTLANPTGHDSGGAAPTLTGKLVPTAPFVVNVPADQPSCNLCIDANDLRIPSTPVVRNGILYGAWGTAIDNGNSSPHPPPGIEWAQVGLSDLSTTTGYYSFAGDEAATYPAVMPDASGNVTMLFEHMGHKVFPETRYIVKGAGDSNFSGAGNLLKAGESSYRPTLCGTKVLPVCRWGDFEATSFDGAGHIWFAGQYANLFQGVTTPPAFGRNWGTWIGAISAS